MNATFDLFAGLASIPMGEEHYDLGHGVTLSRTFAHLNGSFILAFAHPKAPGEAHPAPWLSVPGGSSFDVVAELRVPAQVPKGMGTSMDVARTVLMMLRLGVHPGIASPVIANFPLATMPGRPANEVWLRANERSERFFRVESEATAITPDHAAWLAKTWPVAMRLQRESEEFALALQALDASHFIQSTALSLVSLWAALEALFSPSTSELRFRVSALLATFLEEPGTGRHDLQRQVSKLYDKRSAAAHGKPKHEDEDLLATMNLVVRALVKMLNEEKVTSKADIEGCLFGR